MSLNFMFVFEPLRFRHICPSFLLSKFASEIKLIQSVVGVSCQPQGSRIPLPGFRVSGSHVPGSQIPGARAPVPESRGPKSEGVRVSDPGSQVLILDYTLKEHLCNFKIGKVNNPNSQSITTYYHSKNKPSLYL